jgi:hypothetical protein
MRQPPSLPRLAGAALTLAATALLCTAAPLPQALLREARADMETEREDMAAERRAHRRALLRQSAVR